MHNHRQSGFAHLLLVAAMVVVLAGVGWLAVTRNSTAKRAVDQVAGVITGGDTDRTSEWTKGCTSDARVPMTHLPMNIADVASFTPYGLTAGAHVTPIDHLYFYPKPGPRDTYPVYAMADGYITEITVRGVSVDSGQARPPEYRYMIQHSCQTISYFDLVTKIDDSITQKYPEAAAKGVNGVRIPVKAGQTVGWIGGQSLDTAVYNLDMVLPGFISPKLYESEPWKIHTDDFFSYFSAEHQAQMLGLSLRKVQPYSGKIDYDQPGKLIGNWFKEGTNGYAGPDGTGVSSGGGRGYWSGHLSIHYHVINPANIVVSLGEFDGGAPQAFGVKGNVPDPAAVTAASGIVKYELVQRPNRDEVLVNPQVQGVVLFQVLEGEKLKMQVFPGKTGAQVSGFTSPIIYER